MLLDEAEPRTRVIVSQVDEFPTDAAELIASAGALIARLSEASQLLEMQCAAAGTARRMTSSL